MVFLGLVCVFLFVLVGLLFVCFSFQEYKLPDGISAPNSNSDNDSLIKTYMHFWFDISLFLPMSCCALISSLEVDAFQ